MRRAQLVKMVFEAVYLDAEAGQIVAYRPKDQYPALLGLCEGLREETGRLVTKRYDELASWRLKASTFRIWTLRS